MASKNAPAAHQKHLAALIDADNAPAAIVEGPFEEILVGLIPPKSIASYDESRNKQKIKDLRTQSLTHITE